MNKPTKVITHHAVSSTQHTHLDVGQWHYNRWYDERWGGYRPSRIRSDIARYAGYHIIVNWDGSWEQCRGFTEEGIHCKGQNFSSIGVCFMGNNDVHMPSIAQVMAWQQEVWPLIVYHYPDITPNDVYPHRQYANKSCHGALLSNDYWTKQLTGVPQKVELQKQLLQLLNRLYTLLSRERMR